MMNARLFLVCVMAFLLSFAMVFSAHGAVYSTEFPSYIPLSGGAYFETNVASLGQVSAVFPLQYKNDTFGFTGTGNNICNLTNSTVSGYLYRTNGTTYSCRFTRQGTLEYQATATATWTALSTSAISNTNIQFVDQTVRDRQTDNYDISRNDRLLRITLPFVAILMLGGILLCWRRYGA